MANILACKMYSVEDHSSWFKDRSTEQGLERNYAQMAEVMTASAKKYCTGLDRVEMHTGTMPNMKSVFQQHLVECYALWRQGHSVLSVDLDVVFLKHHNWFENRTLFQMYNFTDPARTYDPVEQKQIPYYLNCGIKLFPQDMSREIWEQIWRSFKTWDDTRYDHEQIVLNHCFWNQGSPQELSKLLDARVWQCLTENPHDTRNIMHNQGVTVDQAVCVHVHGSRGSANRLQLMRQLASQYQE